MLTSFCRYNANNRLPIFICIIGPAQQAAGIKLGTVLLKSLPIKVLGEALEILNEN